MNFLFYFFLTFICNVFVFLSEISVPLNFIVHCSELKNLFNVNSLESYKTILCHIYVTFSFSLVIMMLSPKYLLFFFLKFLTKMCLYFKLVISKIFFLRYKKKYFVKFCVVVFGSMLLISPSYCQGEIPIDENIFFYPFTNDLIMVWVLFLNVTVFYSYYRNWKNTFDQPKFQSFLPILLFSLVFILIYNDIILIFNSVVPEFKIPESNLTPGNWNLYMTCLTLTSGFAGFTSKLLRKENIGIGEYNILLFFLTFFINIGFLFKESNLFQKMQETGILNYVCILNLIIKTILLLYIIVICLVYLETKNESYVIYYVTDKVFLYFLLFQGTLACSVWMGICTGSVYNNYYVQSFLNIVWILSICVVLYTSFSTESEDNCNNRNKHLENFDKEEFSSFAKRIDTYIFSRVPDSILSLLFLQIKKKIDFILLGLSFIPCTLLYVYPFVIVSQYKILTIVLLLVVGNIFDIFLAIPTTRKHLYKVGLFCCYPLEGFEAFMAKLAKKNAESLNNGEDGEAFQKKNPNSTTNKGSNTASWSKVKGYQQKNFKISNTFGPEEAGRRWYKGGEKFNWRRNGSSFNMTNAGIVASAVILPYAYLAYKEMKFPSFTVDERLVSIKKISIAEINAIEQDEALSPDEKTKKKAEVYSTERISLAKLKQDMNETNIKSFPEAKAPSDTNSAEKGLDKAREDSEKSFSIIKTLWDLLPGKQKPGK